MALTMSTGDAVPLCAFLDWNDDIALVYLRLPADDVTPIPLYRGRHELGQTVEIVGKGATGTHLIRVRFDALPLAR